MQFLNYEGLAYYHSRLTEWIKNNHPHDGTKTAQEAFAAGTDGIVYFPTDRSSIIFNGVEYGKKPDLSSYATKTWVEDKKYLVASDIAGKLDIDVYNTDVKVLIHALSDLYEEIEQKNLELKTIAAALHELKDQSGGANLTWENE